MFGSPDVLAVETGVFEFKPTKLPVEMPKLFVEVSLLHEIVLVAPSHGVKTNDWTVGNNETHLLRRYSSI